MVREEFISVAPFSVSVVAVTAVMEICGSLGTGGTAIVYTTYSLPQHKELDFFPHCGVAVQLHSFLASTLIGCESSTSSHGRLNPGKGGPLHIERTIGSAAEPVGHRSSISKYSRP
jgi:hypothetical protein